MKYAVLALIISSLVSCSSSKVVNTQSAEGVDFKNYKTFNFYKLNTAGIGADTLSTDYQTNIALLQSAITREMQQRGYELSVDEKDLLVNIGIVVQEKIQTRQTDFRTDAPKYIGQRNYSWKSEDVEVGSFREGTVTVDIVDVKENKKIWEGTVEDVIPEKQSKVAETIQRSIHKLFQNYPLNKTGTS
jgi:hypothetical protein